MKNKIGVIIATYNGEKYISEQLQSIINQSIKPNFILITDGGSTDKTISICEKILLNSKIEYKILKSKKKLNVKENFEQGLKNCDTDYIFFSDQDDFWLPNKIKNIMECFDDSDVKLVFSNAYIVDEKLEKTNKKLWNKVEYKCIEHKTIYKKNDFSLHQELLKHNIMTGMCMAINKSIKNDLLPFSNNSIHDVWIAHCSNNLGNVISLNSCDVLYRQHSNNVIGTNLNIKKSFEKRKEYLNNIKKKKNFIKDILSNIKLDNKIYNSYLDFISFLDMRIDYIEKKKNVFYILLIIKLYRKYDYKYKRSIIKDIYSRFSL